MELRHLRYFVTVAQEGSFTKAADKLFTAQPSLSQQIKDLEAEIGVLLIDRSGRQIRLTEEGQAFLPHALATLDNAKRAISAARQVAANKNHQLHIGFLNVAEIKVLPLILDKLQQRTPQIQVHIQSLTCLEQIQRLKNAELDLSFTRYAIHDQEYENLLLLTEKIYLVAAQTLHPAQRSMSLDQLKQKKLIMCEQIASPVFYEKVNTLLNFNAIPEMQLHWVTNVLQHINLINMGFGYSFLPEYALKFLNPNISVIETDFVLPTLPLYANYRKHSGNQALHLLTAELKQAKP